MAHNVEHTQYYGPPDYIDSKAHLRDLVWFTQARHHSELKEVGVNLKRLDNMNLVYRFPDGSEVAGVSEAWSKACNIGLC